MAAMVGTGPGPPEAVVRAIKPPVIPEPEQCQRRGARWRETRTTSDQPTTLIVAGLKSALGPSTARQIERLSAAAWGPVPCPIRKLPHPLPDSRGKQRREPGDEITAAAVAEDDEQEGNEEKRGRDLDREPAASKHQPATHGDRLPARSTWSQQARPAKNGRIRVNRCRAGR